MLSSRRHGIIIAIALAMVATVAPMRAASAACVPIRTVNDLNLIRQDLTGSYCLKNDLDLAAVANFKPIGYPASAFSGILDGGNFVIRNLSIHSGGPFVGLFSWLADGEVRNLTLAGVNVVSTRKDALTGAVAGAASGASTISRVRVAGSVECSGLGCRVGGLVGQIFAPGVIRQSSVAAWVTGGNGGAAGGVAGQSGAKIARSFATGAIACGANCAAGGIAGHTDLDSVIANSFSAGPVRGTDEGMAGAISGTQYGQVTRVYSTGSVRLAADGIVGSFIGYHGGQVRQGYAVGRVKAGAGSSTGGLIALLAPPNPKTSFGYWDLTTADKGTSAQGSGKTTAQLQAALPAGFDAAWGITKGYSYPFLDDTGMRFASALATTVKAGKIYSFLPLEQREPTEYRKAPDFADRASLAAGYAMIARAIGITDNIGSLKRVKIDQYWNDAARTATWTGPVTSHATLGSVRTLAANTAIGDSNIIGPLKARNIVLIRGHYSGAHGQTVVHWMLATLFTSNNAGVTTSLVANDPWTGQQVWINPATKRVVRPAGFPLTNFRVDGYRVVTLN